MKRFTPQSLATTALVLSLMAAAFSAGMAHSAGNDNLTMLNNTHDLLTKARATLQAVATRKGYSDVENAKKNVDEALTDINKAVAANGG